MADPASRSRFKAPKSHAGPVPKPASQAETVADSAEAKRKLLDDMPVRDMMKYLAENFEEVLGDLSDTSGKTLEAQLLRAWECREWGTLTAEIEAHTKLLRSMCPVLCAAGQDKQGKKLLADFGDKIDEGLKYFMRQLDHVAKSKLDEDEKNALHQMIGERLRTHILTLPSSKRTEQHINKWFGPCFSNEKMIDRASWDEMLRLVLTRTDEPLSYLDLENPASNANSGLDEKDAEDKEKCTVS